MSAIWKTPEGGEAVRARYAQIPADWPVANTQLWLPTAQGETFVIASGQVGAPTVLLLHGSLANTTSWMGDVAMLAQHFRVYAVDMIGEPGFSAPSRPLLASDAYVVWLDEVMAGLGVDHAALVGISLGGWLALDYATRRPGRVSALVLLFPGGVGKTKNVLLWAAPLMLLGAFGRRLVMRRLGGGAANANSSPAGQAFGAFFSLIQANFRPRRQPLPRFSGEGLRSLTVPVLAILGAKDAILHSNGTRRRLTADVPHADICWLADGGHFLVGHGAEIDTFFAKALQP